MEKTHSRSSFKSMFSYFEFMAKYLLKKRSTWLSPLIFGVVFIAISAIIGNLTGQDQATNLRMFQSMSGMFSIVFFSIFGMIKGINLFRDPSGEGIELLVVSKPLERWHIILVKFILFNIVGLVFFIVNIILFGICAAILGVDAGAASFTSIALGIPVTNWFSYLLFGTLSILISIKFNSKTILGVGMVVVMALSVGDTFFSNFSSVFIKNQTDDFKEKQGVDPFTPPPFSYYIDEKGRRIPFVKGDFKLGMRPSDNNLLVNTARQINLSNLVYFDTSASDIENVWNKETSENLWQYQMSLYLNPISAFNKLGLLGNYPIQSDSSRSANEINENDYSWSAETVTNFSAWNDGKGTNYSLKGIDLKQKNYNVFKLGAVQESAISGRPPLATADDDHRKPATESKLKNVFIDNDPESTTNWVEVIKGDRSKISNLIDTTLNSLSSTSQQSATDKKTKAITAIKAKLSDFGDFFGKYAALTYFDENGSEQKDWTNSQDHQATFLYYLAHLVAVNDHFDAQGQSASSANEFRAEIAKAIETIQTTGQPTKPGFFGEQLESGIQKIEKAQMVKLVPHARTQTWGIVLLWVAIIMGINAGTIFMYFKEDFR